MSEASLTTDRFPWERNTLDILITNWESEASLFDKSDKTYNAPHEREAAYAKIQMEIRKAFPNCQLSVEHVRNKIISLRCQYNRERRRLQKKTGQTAGGDHIKSPWWYRRLHFLSNYITSRRSKYECSLADGNGFYNYTHCPRVRSHLNREVRRAASAPYPHIPSNHSSYETDDSRPAITFAEPTMTTMPVIMNIKQECETIGDNCDGDDDQISFNGADDDNIYSESSISGHPQSSTGPMQTHAESDGRIFQDAVLHSTSNLLHTIRKFMDQTAIQTKPIGGADSLQSFGQFLVSSLAEIKDDHIVTEAQEACIRAIFAAKNAWHRKKTGK